MLKPRSYIQLGRWWACSLIRIGDNKIPSGNARNSFKSTNQVPSAVHRKKLKQASKQ